MNVSRPPRGGVFIRVTVLDAAFDSVRAAFYRARVESRPIVLDAPGWTFSNWRPKQTKWSRAAKLFPVRAPRPDAALLGDAARLIGESQRPVIIAGRGAVHAGAREAIVQLGERSGALRWPRSLAAKNLFAGRAIRAAPASRVCLPRAPPRSCSPQADRRHCRRCEFELLHDGARLPRFPMRATCTSTASRTC